MNQEALAIYENRIKPPQEVFDEIIYSTPKYEWSNKSQTIIGSDREAYKTIKKRLTKNSILQFVSLDDIVDFVFVKKDRVEFQRYNLFIRYRDGKEYVGINLLKMDVFDFEKHYAIKACYSYTARAYTYDFTDNSDTLYYNKIYSYDDFLEKIESFEPLKYLNLTNLYAYEIVFFFPRIVKYRNEIEFLQKIRATRIAEEVMIKQADMRYINRNWLKKHKPLLKNNQVSFLYFELNELLKKRGSKIVPGIEKYLKLSDIKRLPKNINATKFQNYILKVQNQGGFYDLINYYFDYLNTLNDLNITPNSDSMWFPKDLVKSHDEAVNLLNQMKREADIKGYQEKLPKILYLEKQVGNYLFTVPKDLNEIIEEGKNMHHCVGGSYYIENHKNLKAIIVFMRHVDNPNKSLYTIELKDGQINQHRGKYNANPSAEAKRVAEKWLKIVTKEKNYSRAGIRPIVSANLALQ